jgi:hypothetical protein
MPGARRLLRRFLPAGAPGPAGLAGVPTDRVADVTAELAPVFAALAATEARCDEILERGRRDAVDAGRRATERVRVIAATAERRAAAERVDALARAQRAAEEQSAAELAAAQAEADRLREDALGRISGYVTRVTAAVAAMLAATGPDGAG